MSVEITPYNSKKHHEYVTQIFFETSSRKTFYSEKEKNDFRHKYLDLYLESSEALCYVAHEGDDVIGYLVGSLHTGELFTCMADYYDYFSKELVTFPAHLHINLTSQARGKGIGKILIEEFIKELEAQKVPGVHIITLKSARNTHFYRACGFSFEKEDLSNSLGLLFMGRSLITAT